MFEKIYNFINLGRYNKPLGALLLAWPCTWGVTIAKPDYYSLIFFNILFFFSAFILRGAGCAWNDIIDRNIDKNIERTKNRPIASKKLSVLEGLIFTIVSLLFGLITLSLLSKEAIILSLISIPLIIIYPLTKRITFFPQVWLGITFNIGILIGYATISNNYFSIPILLLYFGAILWTIAYDTIYAIQDYIDDKKNNIKSTATYTNVYAGKFASIFYLLSSIIFIISFDMSNLGLIPKITAALVGIWQSYIAFNLNVYDKSKAYKGFKISTFCGGILLVSILVDIYF